MRILLLFMLLSLTQSFLSSSSKRRLLPLQKDNIDFFASPQEDDDDDPKLGIDVGKMLDPLSDAEAAELKAAATEIINESIASGLDEIEKLRAKMQSELKQTSAARKLESEWNAQQETERLMSKIDALTDAFLAQTQASRQSTKLVALADRNSVGKSTELGVWGELDGMAVTTKGGSLLGSVMGYQIANAIETFIPKPANRLLIVADPASDPYAKRLVEPLTELLTSQITDLIVDVYKPTETIPLGADSAQCVLFFLTSLSDPSTVSMSMERLIRVTLNPNGGPVSVPPTQFVAVSSLGTERTNKMPYSMQNLMGGTLDNRRRMEETLMNIVNKEEEGSIILDYTICKFGDLKPTDAPFSMLPGDVLDGPTDVQTAATILAQAIAFQPAARNATLSCVGNLGTVTSETQSILDDAFLRLDGPELLRMDLVQANDRSFGALVEYLIEWGHLLGNSGEIVTPLRVALPPAQMLKGVVKQSRMQLLFLPTRTGKYYTSQREERDLESRGQKGIRMDLRKNPKEGGLEFTVEITDKGATRVRVKRANYLPGVVIKEKSEDIILNRFKRAIDYWQKTRS